MKQREVSDEDYEVQDSGRKGGPADQSGVANAGITRNPTITTPDMQAQNPDNAHSYDQLLIGGGIEMFSHTSLKESASAPQVNDGEVNPDDIQLNVMKLGQSASGKMSQSQKERSQINKSASGFDIGEAGGVGSFFSVNRQKQENKDAEPANDMFDPSEEMKGKSFVDRLIKQQESRYQKRMPFERGQYHQCLPNPLNDKQLITLQLVKRVLEGKGEQQIMHDVFDADQAFVKTVHGESSEFVRYNIVPPRKPEDQDQNDDGEGEGDDEDMSAPAISEVKLNDQSRLGLSARSGRSGFGGGHADELYDDLAETEIADKIAGIEPQLYADIDQCQASQNQMVRAQMNCQEYAIVATWELEDSTNRFICKRFFLIPNPMKRTVVDQGGTELHQVLYSSHHTQEIFFFFKGYSVTAGADIDLGAGGSREFVTQCSFIKLEMDDKTQSDVTDRRHVEFHCRDFVVLTEGGVLQRFIHDLNTTSHENQLMMPCATVIKTPNTEIGRSIVFTAYLSEQNYSKAETQPGEFNEVRPMWYPTIFFYDLYKNRTVWEIFGGEQFIKVDYSRQGGSVLYLTNDIWFDENLDQQEYEWLQSQAADDRKEFSRHTTHFDRVQEVIYGQSPTVAEEADRYDRAPEIANRQNYRLKFGSNKDLIITEGVKVVEAHIHQPNQQAEKRLTLIYNDIGSFTFILAPATPLILESDWLITKGHNKDSVSHTTKLRFHKFFKGQYIATGTGVDENDNAFDIEIAMRPAHMDKEANGEFISEYEGYIDTEQGMQSLMIENLGFDKQKSTMSQAQCTIKDEDVETVLTIQEGIIGEEQRKKPSKNHRINFKLVGDEQNGTMIFDGVVNPTFSRINGKWWYENKENEKQNFELKLNQKVEGTLRFLKPGTKVENQETGPQEVEVDFMKRMIKSRRGQEHWIKMEAQDAVDSANLIYFIKQPDVKFVRNEHTNEAFVQAKLLAYDNADDDSNGTGVCDTQVILYNVNQVVEEKKNVGKGKDGKKQKKDKKKILAAEPTERDYIKFYLNQTYQRTQEKKETQMWCVNPSTITADGRFIGSIIYEEFGSDEQLLNMVTGRVKQDQDAKEIDYPQQPVPQSWMVDYPLLAYKTVTPMNREIAIVNMVHNMPQKIIHLGQWEFVSFVNHTQMVEQKLFGKEKETNCDIMMLVRRKDKYRLMSFKCNPWLDSNEQPTGIDMNVIKHSFYLFSGSLKFELTEDNDGDEMKEHDPNMNRRFNNDKIQSVQLITQRLSGVEQYMLIIQFNDCIVMASLNKKIFKVIVQPEAMVRRHLVRGYNEKVFFAESVGNAEKIFMLQFNMSNDIKMKEIYQLAGTWIVAFEADPDHIQNDMEDDCSQSLYIMDDSEKIYKLKNEDGVKFVVENTFDFSSHKMLKQLNEMRDNDWAHVHITDRTLSFGDSTYNLHSELMIDIGVPEKVFGDPKSLRSDDVEIEVEMNDENDSNDEAGGSASREEAEWMIQSVQAMPMTANMIALAMKGHQDFCFVIKPGPGSRRVNIVGYQQVFELTHMLFVTNIHVLLKFNGGKAVTLLSNGNIVAQPKRIQEHLEAGEVISESQINNGRKFVLLKQEYDGDGNEKVMYLCISFGPDGIGELVGKFDQPLKTVNQAMEKLAESISNQKSSDVLKKAKTMIEESNSLAQAVMKQALAATDNTKNKSKAAQKMRPKFSKEFFMTEKGEIIKMAAVVTRDPEIIQVLEERKQKFAEANSNKTKKGAKIHDNTNDHYITIVDVPNMESQNEKKTQCKFVVFHCLDDKQQDTVANNTQFCVVGSYLCHRERTGRMVWVTKLPDSLEYDKKFISRSLPLSKMVSYNDKFLIQMTEVPKAYFTTIKSVQGLKNTYYSSLLQITERSNGMIFDLEPATITEVDAIENLDQMQSPDEMVNTGFIISTSKREESEEKKFFSRHQVFTNEYVNLLIEKKQQRYFTDDDKTIKITEVEKQISGMLFRTFSEIDLFELKKVCTAVRNRTKIQKIDDQAIISTYEGHTIFSIFQDNIDVYEQILLQLEQKEFTEYINANGDCLENGYLRRLHRILTLPTADWFDTKELRENMIAAENGDQDEIIGCCKSFGIWMRMKLGMGDGQKVQGNIGFKSIRNKSVHFTSSRFRENLMEISMLTQENSIIDFVQNLDDIQILFTSMSPATVEFFQSAFNTTKYTKTVNNLDWTLGDTIQVFGGKSSAINQKAADDELNDGKATATESDEVQNRQVVTKMLSLDWIHGGYKGYKDVGFKEFIVELANAPHESLFSTELVITLVEHFWDYYYLRVLWAGFIPYSLYFIATIIYITNWAVDGIPEDQKWELTPEFFLRWYILFSVVYFGFFEIVAFIRDGKTYFYDIFNLFDWMAFVLNFYTVFTTVFDSPQQQIDSSVGRLLHAVDEETTAAAAAAAAAVFAAAADPDAGTDPADVATDVLNYDLTTRRGFAAVLVLLMWIKTFYWMRLFSPTSFYIRLISETLVDIKYFLILLIFILMTFGNTLLVMNQGRSEDGQIITDVFGYQFIDAIFNQYLLGMGEFDVENFKMEGKDTIIWLIFIATTFITQITFLNMLIAIMGDTFGRVSEVKEQSALSEKLKILADYVIIVRNSKLDEDKYLFSISPAQLGSDEQSSWEGTVTTIKKAIDKSMAIQNKNFSKKIDAVSTEVTQVNNRLSSLDDRINDLASSTQLLPTTEAIEKSMRRILSEILAARDGVPNQGEAGGDHAPVVQE